MPSQISWYVEKRVVAIRVYGSVKEKEFVEDRRLLESFIKDGDSPLFLLFDLRDVTKLPTNFGDLLQGVSTYRWNKHVAWTIVLSNNSLFSLFGVLASKATGVPMWSFKTLEQANDFIAHHATELATKLPSYEAG